MIKIKINSQKYNQEFTYCFETQEAVDNYLADIAANGMYGAPEREILISPAVIETNEQGEQVVVTPAVYETLASEYTVEIIDLSQDYEFLREKAYNERRNAYGDWRDQLDMIYHYGIEGWEQHIAEVKTEHPLPEEPSA